MAQAAAHFWLQELCIQEYDAEEERLKGIVEDLKHELEVSEAAADE